MTTTMLMVLLLFVFFVTLSVGRLRKLQREAKAQLDLNLRMGGEVHQGLTALAGQSAAFGALVARSSGEVQEAIGRIRAAADLAARGESPAPELGPAPVDEDLAPEHKAPLLEALGPFLYNFAVAAREGQVPREQLCIEASAQLRQLLDELPPAQRHAGAAVIFIVLTNSLMTAALEGASLRP